MRKTSNIYINKTQFRLLMPEIFKKSETYDKYVKALELVVFERYTPGQAEKAVFGERKNHLYRKISLLKSKMRMHQRIEESGRGGASNIRSYRIDNLGKSGDV